MPRAMGLRRMSCPASRKRAPDGAKPLEDKWRMSLINMGEDGRLLRTKRRQCTRPGGRAEFGMDKGNTVERNY